MLNVYHFICKQVPDIIDNAFVIIEFENGTRGMLDLCMFAEGSKNEQEISVVGDIGKVILMILLSFHYLKQYVSSVCHHEMRFLPVTYYAGILISPLLVAGRSFCTREHCACGQESSWERWS